jgi:hypothetical protein
MTPDACECEEGIIAWSPCCPAGVCPECACVYVHATRRSVEVYSLDAFLDACRLSGRWPFGGEA